MDVILGKNGFIWIARTIPEEWRNKEGDVSDDSQPVAEVLQALKNKHASTPIEIDERLRITRVRNCIQILR